MRRDTLTQRESPDQRFLGHTENEQKRPKTSKNYRIARITELNEKRLTLTQRESPRHRKKGQRTIDLQG